MTLFGLFFVLFIEGFIKPQAMKRKLIALTVFLAVGIVFGSYSLHAQASDWSVPDKYHNMKNPVPADKASIALGKELWNLHCKSCHGKEGLGDGPKAAQLDTPAGDFSTDAFHNQTDGDIFYKSWIGRDEMPNYEKKIPDKEDVWAIVNFIRTLAE